MAKDITEIINAAAVVRDETGEAANTAARVGGSIADVAQYIQEEIITPLLAAQSQAVSAERIAEYAKKIAEDAITAATAAQTTAEQAKQSATNSFDIARSATLNATTAETTADAAKANADAAKATAEAALAKNSDLEREQIQGGVYDVSAHNNGAVFESLSSLLDNANLSTLIPASVRHGGMSIRFIQGSDNNYKRYNLISDTFTTDTTKWTSSDVSDELKEEIEAIDTKGALDRIVLDVDRGFNKTKVISAIKGTALTYTDNKIEVNISQGTTFNIQLNNASNILGSGNVYLYIKNVNGSWNAPTLIEDGDSGKTFTTNQDLEAVSFATNATNVVLSGDLSFKIWREAIVPSVIKEKIKEALDNVGVESAQQAVSFLGEYDIATFSKNVNSAIIGGDMSKPKHERNFNNGGIITTNQITDEFLASKHLSYIFSNNASILSGNPINISSIWYYGNDEICSYVLLNKNKYIELNFMYIQLIKTSRHQVH